MIENINNDLIEFDKPTPFQVYAVINKEKQVEKFYSTCFQEPIANDILIKEGYGDEFVHVGYYQVYNENGCHNYKIVEGKIVECTNEEKVEELKQMQKNTPKTTDQKIVEMARAITDTMLERM